MSSHVTFSVTPTTCASRLSSMKCSFDSDPSSSNDLAAFIVRPALSFSESLGCRGICPSTQCAMKTASHSVRNDKEGTNDPSGDNNPIGRCKSFNCSYG
jgi:hypothetical protein